MSGDVNSEGVTILQGAQLGRNNVAESYSIAWRSGCFQAAPKLVQVEVESDRSEKYSSSLKKHIVVWSLTLCLLPNIVIIAHS